MKKKKTVRKKVSKKGKNQRKSSNKGKNSKLRKIKAYQRGQRARNKNKSLFHRLVKRFKK
ncbi:MAG: hypothetical protein AABX54_05190 [Nanoarchaeota archaeon]